MGVVVHGDTPRSVLGTQGLLALIGETPSKVLVTGHFCVHHVQIYVDYIYIYITTTCCMYVDV